MIGSRMIWMISEYQSVVGEKTGIVKDPQFYGEDRNVCEKL